MAKLNILQNIGVIVCVLLIIITFTMSCNTENISKNQYPYTHSEKVEKFGNGALQSLYSNDGMQDIYLTLENDPKYYDPYKYWRGVPWDIPTRNLDRVTFYPYLYENYVDRYGTLYPYW